MKNLKKVKAFTASILVTAMAMSMATGFAAFAVDGEDNTSTTKFVIEVPDDGMKHTYEAYQIFDAKIGTAEGEDDGERFMVEGWGNGVKPGTLIDELGKSTLAGVFTAALDEAKKSGADNVEVARKVARALEAEDYEYDAPELQKFAKIVAKALNPDGAITKVDKEYNQINVGKVGYYLIKDTDDSNALAKTRYILTASTDVVEKAKADAPSIVKKINEKGDLVDYNTASIGDTITYQLNSNVPDMTGYNKYFYIVNDSLFKGLTLDKTSFKIEIGGEEIAADQFYYKDIVDTKEDYDDFEIVLVDFIQYKDIEDKKIVITYDATLNENAKIGSEGNPNFVDLTFSNDPNHEYEGDTENEKPDEPKKPTEDEPGKPGDPGDPMGKTPPSEVVTYTTGIELTKVDVRDTNKRLNGAEFTIKGDGVNKVVKVSNEYVADEEGTYYKLKNGTYTDEAPTDDTKAKYDGTEKYKQVTKSVELDSEGKMELTVLEVDTDGVLRINGLNAGEYTITETKAPEGYVVKSTPITFTIGVDSISLESCKWKYEPISGATDAKSNDKGILTFKVTNRKGVSLPGTGAFGSKIFYALGTIFTGVGAAYMISRRKSKKEEE